MGQRLCKNASWSFQGFVNSQIWIKISVVILSWQLLTKNKNTFNSLIPVGLAADVCLRVK